MLYRSAWTAAVCSLAALLTLGCTGVGEAPPSPPDTGDEDPDTDPDTDPGTEPEPQPEPNVDLDLVGSTYNAAVEHALTAESPASVQDDGASLTLAGRVDLVDASVEFRSLVLDKAPFAARGAAEISLDEYTVLVSFEGGTSGAVTASGQEVGVIQADLPPVDDLTHANLLWLFGLALECDPVPPQIQLTTVTLSGTCSLADDAGDEVVSVSADLTADLAAQTLDGYVTVEAPSVTAEALFAGQVVELVVNGELVGEIDLQDLVAGLLELI